MLVADNAALAQLVTECSAADAYALDYVLTEHALALPLVHSEGRLKLYRMSPN